MNEIWKSISGFENYEVSNLGNVRSLNYNHTRMIKVLSPEQTNTGYLRVHLSKNGKQKTFRVHRLVAEAFLPNPQGEKEVNHINEIKTDNRVENLEWCSREYNNNYGTRNRRASKALRGKPSGMKGKHHSEETKRKMSEFRKRYWQNKKK